MANYIVKANDDGSYSTVTEIGYMEMGKDVKVVFVPGEICTDLIYGGNALTAEGSVNEKDYEGKTLCEIFGDDIIVFGLANDAVGYIVPENDYSMALAFGHYQELLSLGEKEATVMFEAYENLLD